MDSKILITGADGQLGKALRLKYPGTKALNKSGLDISDQKGVQNYDYSGIEVIINAAAYTNVDGAETDEGKIVAKQVNANGVKNLASVCQEKDIILVHISSDYVFDGTITNHNEDEDFKPLSVYGTTKAEGDKAAEAVPKHYIVRSSWVIGDGKNFVRIMLDLGKKGINPMVVSDEIGRPTFTTEIVRGIDYLLTAKAPYGTYNLSNGGEPVSRADIARAVFKEAGLNNTVTNTTTAEYYKDKPQAANRPLNSVLDLTKIKKLGFEPKDWRVDMAEYIKQELGR